MNDTKGVADQKIRQLAPHDRVVVHYYLPVTAETDFLAYLYSLEYLKSSLCPLFAGGYSQSTIEGSFLADKETGQWMNDVVQVVTIAYEISDAVEQNLHSNLNQISDVLYAIYELNESKQQEIWMFVERTQICVWPESESKTEHVEKVLEYLDRPDPLFIMAVSPTDI